MKKFILISALLCFALLFCACEKEEEYDPFINTQITEWTPPRTSPTTKSTLPAESEKVEVTTAPTEKETTKKKKKKNKKETEVPTQGVANPNGHIPVTTVMGNTSDEDLIFTWKDSTIVLNEKIEHTFIRVGEDNSSQEISATEMSYEYEDFIIYTYTDKKGVERVRKVELLMEKYTTTKGVSYGDYASSLRKYYGNPVYQEAGVNHYGSKTKRIIFTHKNNKITEITYEFFPK